MRRASIGGSVVSMARSVALSGFVFAAAGLLFILAASATLVVDAARVSSPHGHLLAVAAAIIGLVLWLCLIPLILMAIRPLANAASQAWVDIRHANGMLKISVTDDGRGGADHRHSGAPAQ